jgi:hypothetical protein
MAIIITLFTAYKVTKITLKKIGVFWRFSVIHRYPKVDKEKNAGILTNFFFQSHTKKVILSFSPTYAIITHLRKIY